MPEHGLPVETDVCIVGAGPVGSALALELRLRGVSCVVVEKTQDISYDMRAMNNDMRTMEHLRRWGLADRLRTLNPVPPEFQKDICFCTALHGEELGVWRAYGWRAEDSVDISAEAGQPISQKHTGRVLREGAEHAGAIVALGWECVGLSQTEDHVFANLLSADQKSQATIKASYLVGCDGGRSTVRSAAAITRSGAGGMGKHVHVVVGCPGLLSDVPISPAAFYIVFNPAAGGLLLPSATDEFNFHIAGLDADDDITGLDLEGLARTMTGLDAPMEIKSVSPYLIHERIADAYRSGRVFIAGDAAHLFCPFGGFNMNTGISDAANLGWKLAACVQGWGGDVLLDSYGDERRPIALRNCAEATFNVNALVAAVSTVMQDGIPEGNDQDADQRRREIGQMLYDRTYREWNVLGVVLDQRYDGSPVVIDDGSDVPQWDVSTYVPSAKPGHRAPHAWLNSGASLYDACGQGFALLDLGADPDDVAALAGAAGERGIPLNVVAVAEPAIRGLYETPLALIRPDQHVAWRGSSAGDDPLALIDVVRGAVTSAIAAEPATR